MSGEGHAPPIFPSVAGDATRAVRRAHLQQFLRAEEFLEDAGVLCLVEISFELCDSLVGRGDLILIGLDGYCATVARFLAVCGRTLEQLRARGRVVEEALPLACLL